LLSGQLIKTLTGDNGVLVGGGGLDVRDREWDHNRDFVDAFFVAEPWMGVEINVTDFAKFGVSGSYRFVSGVSAYGFKDNDFSGGSLAVTFKFGGF
jgi:hypothetical protein